MKTLKIEILAHRTELRKMELSPGPASLLSKIV